MAAARRVATGAGILRFPLPLTVGTDICRVSRIYRLLAPPPAGAARPDRGARFVERVLTSAERAPGQLRVSVALVLARTNRGSGGDGDSDGDRDAAPAPAVLGRDGQLWKAAEFMAGRFAAKEAAIKAHPHRALTFHDIEIVRPRRATVPGAAGAAPVAIIRGAAEGVEDQEAMVSISHDGEYATAVCIGFDAMRWGGDGDGDGGGDAARDGGKGQA